MNHPLRRSPTRLRGSRRAPRASRRGAILVLSAFLMLVMLGMVAFALDTGYITTVKTQLQASADAGALAGASSLLDGQEQAETVAQRYAEANRASGDAVSIVPGEDLEIGYWDSSERSFHALGGAHPTPNAVRVTARLSAARGNQANLFFGRLLGSDSVDLSATAVGVVQSNFKGFKTPPSGNLMLLPFAMDKPSWDAAYHDVHPDDWMWDAEQQQVVSGSDGKAEIDAYPDGNHMPGNRGLVDIGPQGGKQNTLRRQILEGITAEDLAYHGGKLELDYQGELQLGGTPGVRATLETELSQIIGQPRILPLFTAVSGQGNNATYTISGFAAVRVVYVKLKGNPKQLIVQPANIVVRGGIPATEGTMSQNIYAPPYLAN